MLEWRQCRQSGGHDGVRQFLPAFGLLALLAGLGTASVVERLGRWGQALGGVSLAEAALSFWPLSDST